MLKGLKKFLGITLTIILLGNNFLPSIAQTTRKNGSSSSVPSDKASELISGNSTRENAGVPTTAVLKSFARTHQDIEATGLSTQAITGPFSSIDITKGALRFKLSKPAGSFTAPVSATINGLAFPSVELKKKGRQLFLKGDPGSRTLESLFPDGGTAAIAIMNGDSMSLYLVLLRQGQSISVLPPTINDVSPRHGPPASTFKIFGSNFSPTPSDNVVVFRDRDGREFPIPVLESAGSTLTAIIPPIPVDSDLKNFYSGSIEFRVQTAIGYESNLSILTVDSLPNNPGPVGSVSQEFSQQLQSLASEVENDISSSLSDLSGGELDSNLVKALRGIPLESLTQFRSLIDAAKAGHPQTILTDIDDDGTQERVTLDLKAIDMLERLIIRTDATAEIVELRNRFFNRAERINDIIQSSSCSQTEARVRFLASFAKDLEDYIGRIMIAKVATVIVIALTTLIFPCVPCALAAIYGALLILSWADTTMTAILVALNLYPTKLSRINSSSVRSTINVGGSSTIRITGTFTNDTGAALADSVSLLIGELIKVRLIGYIKDRVKRRLVEEFINSIAEIVIGEVLKSLGTLANRFIPLIETDIPLSNLTTQIQVPSSDISVSELCGGLLTITGRRQTPGVTLRAKCDFPRYVDPDIRTLASPPIEVVVVSDQPVQPSISDISPSTATVGNLNLTIIGTNFNPNTAEVVILGYGCPPNGCVVPNGALLSKSSTRIVAPLTINIPGVFTVVVRNGVSGGISNGVPLTVTRFAQPPVAGFTMSANGITVREGETLRLITPAGQAANVAFSANRSYDPDGGPLRYNWQVSAVPKSNSRDFTFGLGPGTHQISLTVTDDEGSQSSASGIVIVANQELSQPLISDISPVAASIGNFNLTINGTNINPAIAEVVVSGPGCSSGGCVVPNANLITKTPTQIVAPLQINNPGSFIITVRNGAGGAPSNGKTLNITGTSTQPVISLSPTSLSFNLQQSSSGDAKVLNIGNTGGGTLNWNASATTNTGGPWLSLTFTNGTAPSSTTVVVNSVGLLPGTYTGQVNITAAILSTKKEFRCKLG